MFTPEKVKVSPSSSRRGPDLITHKPELTVIQSLLSYSDKLYNSSSERTAKKASLIVRKDIFRLECLSTDCLAFGCPAINYKTNIHSFVACVSRSSKASESGLSLAVYPKEAEVVPDLVTKEEVEVEEISSRRVNMVTTILHN